jgi:DNA-binding NarL/FixJ family response regulator
MIADRVRRAGAHGYASKTQPVQELTATIRTVLQGKTSFPPMGSFEAAEPSEQPQEIRTLLTDSLTNREFEVFHMIGNGLTVRQIAHQSGLAMKTIETHRDRIKAKLKLRNSVELLRLAVICTLMHEPSNGN